jgi:hypothetical protein
VALSWNDLADAFEPEALEVIEQDRYDRLVAVVYLSGREHQQVARAAGARLGLSASKRHPKTVWSPTV